jgi:hypothetical protein
MGTASPGAFVVTGHQPLVDLHGFRVRSGRPNGPTQVTEVCRARHRPLRTMGAGPLTKISHIRGQSASLALRASWPEPQLPRQFHLDDPRATSSDSPSCRAVFHAVERGHMVTASLVAERQLVRQLRHLGDPDRRECDSGQEAKRMGSALVSAGLVELALFTIT